METMPILPESELEAMAALHLGRLLFVFGGLETELGLALVHTRPQAEFESEILRVENLSFHEKLNAFEAQALAHHAGDALALARWQQWFASAEPLRKLREDFAHGRWGFANASQEVVHVARLPGSPDQQEVRYTLDEFAARTAQAEDVAEKFSKLARQYPLDPCRSETEAL